MHKKINAPCHILITSPILLYSQKNPRLPHFIFLPFCPFKRVNKGGNLKEKKIQKQKGEEFFFSFSLSSCPFLSLSIPSSLLPLPLPLSARKARNFPIPHFVQFRPSPSNPSVGKIVQHLHNTNFYLLYYLQIK